MCEKIFVIKNELKQIKKNDQFKYYNYEIKNFNFSKF